MKTTRAPAGLLPHPRLYLGLPERRRVRGPFRHPALRAANDAVAQLAEEYVRGPVFDWERNTHNAHLIRARRMQGRVVTLLARWTQTGAARYRDAALAHLVEMGNWEYWSWIAWRDGHSAPDAIFDLSYGENSATLALGYDGLHDTLDDRERQALLAVARRPVAAFLKHTAPDARAWWFGKRDSNWNTVCAGGAGMLALAFHEDLPEATEALARAVESVGPFVDEIRAARGAWPEGIGYWNYGMRYLYMFALSLERATGRRSDWFRGRAIRDSLDFPMRFAPYPDCGCSFSDVNQWAPLPFHFAAARRLRQPRTLAELDLHLRGAQAGDSLIVASFRQRYRGQDWPNAAELLALHGDAPSGRTGTTSPFLHRYRGQDWTVLADRMPRPRLYASVRGGTTEVPHGHVDLTSFHAVVGGERLLVSLGPSGYLDTTFSARRWELFEMGPASKNVLLIDGVGIARPSSVETRSFQSPWGPAVRLDATAAIGGGRRDNDGVRSYRRLFLLMPGTGLLVVDAVLRPHPSLYEQRFFTETAAKPGPGGFLLRGRRAAARLVFACSEAAEVRAADAPMTQPAGTPPRMLRHLTRRLHEDIVMAALLAPGAGPAPLALRPAPRGGLELDIGPQCRRLRLGPDLWPR